MHCPEKVYSVYHKLHKMCNCDLYSRDFLAAIELIAQAKRGKRSQIPASGQLNDQLLRPWQFLYFLPLPHGQGALRGVPSYCLARGSWIAIAV